MKTNYCTLNDAEIMELINKALNAESIEEKEARRRAKIRQSKADFCNLGNADLYKFVEA